MWERSEDQGSRKHTPGFFCTAAAVCESTSINQASVNLCVCMCNKPESEKGKKGAETKIKCREIMALTVFVYYTVFCHLASSPLTSICLSPSTVW